MPCVRNSRYCSKRSVRSNRSQRGWLPGLMCGMSWMTVPTATSFVNPSPFGDGSGWRGRALVSTFVVGTSLMFLGVHGGQVADPLIEAEKLLIKMLGIALRIRSFYNNTYYTKRQS